MATTLTFGYRFEGLLLHEWAHRLTCHLGIVLPANRDTSDIKQWARMVPCWVQHGKDDPEIIQVVEGIKPDLILCHCYTYRLVPEILRVPRLGCINIHPGKLPEYRGKDPIRAAWDNDDDYLGVSLHYMDEGYDTGDVITWRSMRRGFDMSHDAVFLTRLGLEMLECWWPAICDGTAPRRPQGV